MTTHLALQRILLPSAQVSSLTTGSITLPSARGAFAPAIFDSIASYTVSTSNIGTITFNSISQEYKHLQIRGVMRTDRASDGDYFNMTFNNSPSNYDTTYAYGRPVNSNNNTYITGASSININRIYGGNLSSSLFAPVYIDILDYGNTVAYKTIRAYGGISTNGGSNAEINLVGGTWRNSSAISRIDFVPGGGSFFAQNTTLALYGLRG